jgi:serine phosphatase RsbU (regulator of sigma subunit)
MAFLKGNKTTDAYKQHVRVEENKVTGLLSVIVAFAVAAVAYTDWFVVANISMGYLYVLPIALCALINPLPMTIALIVLCTALTDLFGPRAETPHLRFFHVAIDVAAFLIVGFLVTLIAKQRDRLAAEVRQQRDDYERDLLLASQVQRQVLPAPPTVPGLQLAGAMQAARLLGGDYYDFFQIAEDTVDVIIADVSGKGAAASLLMPSLAVALRLRARELSGPAAIIKDLDTVLKQITNTATFVTIFYARFHPTARTLQYCCGGHNPPLLIRPATGESILLEESGPIVGILPETEFSNTLVTLQQGDILTFYTDGVTEQENEQADQFSITRLKEVVLANETQPASTLVTTISDAVSTYAGTTDQSDDLTVVVVKIL